MSNSRSFERSVKRNVGTVGAVAAGTVGLVALALPGTAFAGVPTTAKIAPPAAPTQVFPGQNSQPAGNVTLTISNTFTAGDTITVPIEPNGAANTGTTAQAVTYSATPSASVAAAAGDSTSDTAPTITASLTTNSADSSADVTAKIQDELVLTIGNSATGTATDTYTITLSGIDYNVGSAVTPEPVDVEAIYSSNNTSPATTYGFTTGGTPGTASLVENADVPNDVVTQTPTGVATDSTGNALAPFEVKEVVPDQVPATSTGAVSTLSAAGGTLSGTATVSVTGFTVAAETSGGACPASGSSSASVAANSSGDYVFCLYGPTSSTTGPGSVTVSGITYSNTSGGERTDAVTLTVGSTPYTTPNPSITVVNNPRIAGFTADDTAAEAALSNYPGREINNGEGGAVILASDAEYQDALSASFLGNAHLASQRIGGGNISSNNGPNPILLNPPTPPSGGEATTAAANAIRKLGASTVYIVGGTDAISSEVQSQLEQIQIGTTVTGSPQYLQVVRIAGFTADETAADVAQYPSLASPQGTLPATPGAYGMYNSGASESSSGPSSGSPTTAILASSNEFQDALSASPLAFSDTLPVLLNNTLSGLDPATSAAITNMGIQQVIVVGGSDAVSDSTVSALEGMGVSVLRVAGTTFDATAAELASFELNYYAQATSSTTSAPVDGLDSNATYSGVSLSVGTSRGDAYQDALSSAQVLGDTVEEPVPLLLNDGTSTIGPATAALLGADGSAPGGLTVYGSGTTSTQTSSPEHILGDVVFGGTLAQTPSLVQAELNAIAAG